MWGLALQVGRNVGSQDLYDEMLAVAGTPDDALITGIGSHREVLMDPMSVHTAD